MDFAVLYEGLAEGQGRWIVAVDTAGDRFLLTNDDGAFEWQRIADCKLVKVATPDQPRMVMVVQPQPQGGVLLPSMTHPNGNRANRRN